MDNWLIRSSSACNNSSKRLRTHSPNDDKGRRLVVTTPETSHCSTSEHNVLVSNDINKKSVKRKYDDSYLKFGFTFTGSISEPIPQCVICMETLSNHSMKPSLLMRHFNTKHANLKNKDIAYFKRKESELKSNKGSMKSFTGLNYRAVEASYKVSLRIAREGKAHTIGESLILPAAKEIVSSILGEKEMKQLDSVSLSNSTVSRRISDMASNVKAILVSKINKSKYFAIQLDETTDITSMPQLMCYIRYEDTNSVCEDILFCKTLPSRTTGEDIFGILNNFVQENNIDWKKCVGVCTDGAGAMVGANSGVVKLIKREAPLAQHVHCSIHREVLITKRCPADLKVVLDETVKVVNFIKGRALNSRLFHNLCEEMDSIHKQLLFHTDVRWLSRGKVLSRVFELRQEILVFLTETNFELRERFTNELWLCRLAYLADVFSKLNELNRSLQGTCITPFKVSDKINALKQKLCFAEDEAKNGKISLYPSLNAFIEENEICLSATLLNDISQHCNILKENVSKYFPEDFDEHLWIKTPFSDIKNIKIPETFSSAEKEELLELNCDTDIKDDFSKTPLIEFWKQRRQDYSAIADKAIRFLLPFSTSYLCEAGFSSLVYLKNKYRNRLTSVENDLRLKLSPITPDITTLSQDLQAHPSH